MESLTEMPRRKTWQSAPLAHRPVLIEFANLTPYAAKPEHLQATKKLYLRCRSGPVIDRACLHVSAFGAYVRVFIAVNYFLAA
jgi:hypothetical protein